MVTVRRFKHGCSFAAVAVSMALSACASSGITALGGGPSEIDRTFLLAPGNWDRNKDGIVTCDEWKAYAAELFDGADSGRKGYLTKDDWASVVKVDRMFETVNFAYYDRNGDGKVDRAELVDRPSRIFELADRDKNCQLTSVELTAARSAGVAAIAKPAVGPPPDPAANPTRGR